MNEEVNEEGTRGEREKKGWDGSYGLFYIAMCRFVYLDARSMFLSSIELYTLIDILTPKDVL